jgi:hypothetical protein
MIAVTVPFRMDWTKVTAGQIADNAEEPEFIEVFRAKFVETIATHGLELVGDVTLTFGPACGADLGGMSFLSLIVGPRFDLWVTGSVRGKTEGPK